MDAKPLKTHIRSFRAFRVIGTFLAIAGGSAGALTLFLLASIVLTVNLAPNIYAGNPAFLDFWAEHWEAFVIAMSIAASIFVMFFAAGIVFIAFSTRSKIRDANRGIDYRQL